MTSAVETTRRQPVRWRFPLARGRELAAGSMPLVMGIVNVTPDSFSDGGLHLDTGRAIAAALEMVEQGAAVIDVGGESTRPGAEPVDTAAELGRVIPVIAGIRRRSEVPISVDTMKAAVAAAALDEGADLVNDVSAMRYDEGMRKTVAERNAPVILMHMRGEPRTMQEAIHYDDLIGEIRMELAEAARLALDAGVRQESILFDPGIGFGKTFEHNVEILERVRDLVSLGPLVIGASRKGFIGKLTGRPDGRPRMAGSLAAAAAAATGGATMVRVHDVAETVDFLKVFGAIGSTPR